MFLNVLGCVVWYRPGPGVLARSSAKPPVMALAVIEYDADEYLLGTLGPINAGRVYELGDGVASPIEGKRHGWLVSLMW